MGADLTAPYEPPHGPNRGAVLTGTILMGLCAAVVFVGWPWLDQSVAALFRDGDGKYMLKGHLLGQILRLGFKAVFVVGCGVGLIALGLGYFQGKRVLGHGAGKWLYLVLCLIIGPGLVANVIFKDHWGRARPIHVSQQGKLFSPALIPSDQCARNCSFVSGEASSIFALFFGLAFMGGRWWRYFLGTGVLLGVIAGLMRMAQGGHYLSDVVFAGVFMALVAIGLSYLLLEDI